MAAGLTGDQLCYVTIFSQRHHIWLIATTGNEEEQYMGGWRWDQYSFDQSSGKHRKLQDMTRTAHHPHPTPSFPVYCLDWADDANLVLGGGGGATRSGIQNKLVGLFYRSSNLKDVLTRHIETVQSLKGWKILELFGGTPPQ